MDAHYTFAGPAFNIQLSPPDQAAVYNWSPRIRAFSLPQGSSNEEILSILCEGMQETTNHFADLAGSCTQPPQPRNEEKQGCLQYHDKGEAHLRVKDHSARYYMEELRKSHFSQGKLLPEYLCPTPAFDHPAMRPLELFSEQANFIKSGLLLVICIYHSICDGVGQFHVTEITANQCRAIGQRKTVTNGTTPPASDRRLSFSPDQFDRSCLFEGAPKADVSTLSSYTILPEPTRGLPAWAMPDGKPLASETFLLRKAALAELKALATSQKPSNTTEPYISTHDAVCALIWRTVMAARLKAGAITATDTVSESLQNLIVPENLGAAAFQIRAGVKSVDDAYLRNFIALLQEVPDMGQVFIDSLEYIKTTGLFLASWAKFAYAGSEWGRSFGECEVFRIPSGEYMNGIAVISPLLRNGDWEVTLTLEKNATGAFKEDDTCRRFAKVE